MDYEHPSPSKSVFNPVMPALDVTDDDAYPTPTGPRDIEKLLSGLPGYARVLCAITAAEMVVHLWEESPIVEEELSDYKDWPRKSLAGLTEFLCEGHSENAPHIITSDMVVDEALIDGQLFAVASAVDDIVWEMERPYEEGASGSGPDYASHAVSDAARAEMIASPSSKSEEAVQSFYEKWWQRCRARLAFRLDKSVAINN